MEQRAMSGKAHLAVGAAARTTQSAHKPTAPQPRRLFQQAALTEEFRAPEGSVSSFSFANIPSYAPHRAHSDAVGEARLLWQAKLEVGAADDPLERQADRVADRVMRMPDLEMAVGQASHAGRETLPRTRERHEEKHRLQRKTEGPSTESGAAGSRAGGGATVAPGTASALAEGIVATPGRALDVGVRSFMEPRFGHDFSGVRIHDDPVASRAAGSVSALAYAVGTNIVFARGQYAPDTQAGRRLLAHELAHVVQQGRAPRALRRFGSTEHKELGDDASRGANSDINVGTERAPEYLTFGDVVALAGDYFGSLEEMRSLARTPQGRAQIAWARWYAIDQYRHLPEPPATPADKQAVRDRYFTLAARNVSHFSAGGTADATYDGQHVEALRFAFEAGASAARASNASGRHDYDLSAARTQEAFAQHFLSDMFAGGHVRTERQAIQTWYAQHMPDSRNQIVAYMARHLRMDLVERHPIASELPVFNPIPPESELRAQILAMGGAALNAFGLGDIVSLAWHDADNRGIAVVSPADDTGRQVPGGHRWVDVGDEMLHASAETRSMALSAMVASLADLRQMAEMGSQSDPRQPSARAFQDALARLRPFAAERFVPRADPTAANPVMTWEWGVMNRAMYDAVDTAVKTFVVGQIRTLAAQRSSVEQRLALEHFADLLEILGVNALEQAVDEPARIAHPRYGLYGEPRGDAP
jgi:hypothetical protein